MTTCRCCGQEIRSTTGATPERTQGSQALWVDDVVAELCNRAREEASRCGSAEVSPAHLAISIAREARHEAEIRRAALDRFAMIADAERRIAGAEHGRTGEPPRISEALRILLARAQVIAFGRGERYAAVADVVAALAEDRASESTPAAETKFEPRSGERHPYALHGAGAHVAAGSGYDAKPLVRIAAAHAPAALERGSPTPWRVSPAEARPAGRDGGHERLAGIEASLEMLAGRMSAIARTISDGEPRATARASIDNSAMEAAIARLASRVESLASTSATAASHRRADNDGAQSQAMTTLAARLDRQDRLLATLLDKLDRQSAELSGRARDSEHERDGRHRNDRHEDAAKPSRAVSRAGGADSSSTHGSGSRNGNSSSGASGQRRAWRIRQRSDWPFGRKARATPSTATETARAPVALAATVAADLPPTEIMPAIDAAAPAAPPRAISARSSGAPALRAVPAPEPDLEPGDHDETSEGRADRGKRFYLSPDDDIVQAPSIGPKTAARLQPCGLLRVRDLLRCNPARVAERLGLQYITARRIAEWQAQARLVCTVPWLRGTHAQLLVGSGYDTLEKLQDADRSDVCAAVLHFAATREGQSVLRSGPPPDMEKIAGWLDHAHIAEPQRAA